MKRYKLLLQAHITVFVFLICLLSFGCATNQRQSAGGAPKTAIAKIAALQNRAQSAAAAFKKSHPATDVTYITARSKYRDAAAKNKGYLAAVQAGVVNREKNLDTPSYRAIAKDAGAAAKEFVDFAEKNTPADVLPVGIAPVVIVAADILINAGIDIWKAYNTTEAEKAKALAESLKEYEWPAWENL